MVTDTDAIVLRQVKTVNGRRMLLLFSQKYGKISVGSNLTESGKNKTALVQRPFTYGHYELFKGRESYNLNRAQVIKSYYGIGEDLDKYMAASYVLELTEKLLADELPQQGMFRLLLEFLDALERRSRRHETLVEAYIVKVIAVLGTMPQLDVCSVCGKAGANRYFSVEEGGMLCADCARQHMQRPDKETLIYDTNFDIVTILKYLQKESFRAFEKIALEEEIVKKLHAILKSWLAYHFGVEKLKSEAFLLYQQT